LGQSRIVRGTLIIFKITDFWSVMGSNHKIAPFIYTLGVVKSKKTEWGNVGYKTLSTRIFEFF